MLNFLPRFFYTRLTPSSCTCDIMKILVAYVASLPCSKKRPRGQLTARLIPWPLIRPSKGHKWVKGGIKGQAGRVRLCESYSKKR